jgi:hypothetical protein
MIPQASRNFEGRLTFLHIQCVYVLIVFQRPYSLQRSTWNQLLLKDVLTPLYATLICDIVKFCLDSEDNKISSIQELIALFPCPAPAGNNIYSV